MEEIVTTEPLEKEILSDARKKAERILKDSGVEAESVLRSGRERTEKSLETLGSDYDSRAKRYRGESLARLPLEKARIKAAHVDALLKKAVSAYLPSLGAAERDRLLLGLLSRAASLVGASPIAVRYSGLSKAEAESLAAKAFPKSHIASVSEDPLIHSVGLIVATQDENLSARATLDLVGERLLDEDRGELAQALCGEALTL
jgi:V/A-type H+/Na+-transporting ATPase subunit E